MCLEQNSIRQRPKDFEASGFPSCFLNNTHFFETSHRKSKKFHGVRKSRNVQQWYMQKVLFYYEDFVYQASELQPTLLTNKVVHAEDTFCYRVFMGQVSKLQNMYVIGLILLSPLKTTKRIRLYPAAHYCTRLQGVKERIA